VFDCVESTLIANHQRHVTVEDGKVQPLWLATVQRCGAWGNCTWVLKTPPRSAKNHGENHTEAAETRNICNQYQIERERPPCIDHPDMANEWTKLRDCFLTWRMLRAVVRRNLIVNQGRANLGMGPSASTLILSTRTPRLRQPVRVHNLARWNPG
jgi:hypothetical protein